MPIRRKRKLSTENETLHAVEKTFSDDFSKRIDSIESAFHLKLPPDYVKFYQFCCDINVDDPLGAIEPATGLRLVGPFECLHQPPSTLSKGQFAQCYRYFHDPPEFITLLVGSDQLHFGCFRDLPSELPSAIVGFDPPSSGKMKIYATNLFYFLEHLLNAKPAKNIELLKKLKVFMQLHEFPETCSLSDLRKRRSKFVCPTLNTMGLLVDIKQDEIGYRPLSVSYEKLTSMLQRAVAANEQEQLTKLEPIDELITYAQFACDEGDYGQSIELGLSMLAFTPKGIQDSKATVFNSRIKHLLSVGYQLAGRPEFATVITDHMNDRRVEPRRLLEQK